MNVKNKIPVCVIIVSYNTKLYTQHALRSLFNSSVLPQEIIVVDNNSTDGSVETIQQNFSEVILLRNQKNVGFAKANNQAINLTKQPYIWLLNSDTETGVKSLEQLYQYLENNELVGALGPQLEYPDKHLQSVGGFFPSISNVFLYLFPLIKLLPIEYKKKIKTIALFPQSIPEHGLNLDYVTGSALMLRKKALEEVGLLGEDYFMYFEETDLCWRLKQKNWQIRVINTEPVIHIYGGSYKSKYDKKRLNQFLISLKKFINKYYRGWRKIIMLLEIILGGKLSILVKGLINKS